MLQFLRLSTQLTWLKMARQDGQTQQSKFWGFSQVSCSLQLVTDSDKDPLLTQCVEPTVRQGVARQ